MEDKVVGAGSPDNCGVVNVANRGCGKAVASSGPLSGKDGCLVNGDELRNLGGRLLHGDNVKNSDDPGKTHAHSELGSYVTNMQEAGEAVGCRGVAKPRTQRNLNNPAAMLDVADGSRISPPNLITERMAV